MERGQKLKFIKSTECHLGGWEWGDVGVEWLVDPGKVKLERRLEGQRGVDQLMSKEGDHQVRGRA